jgi:hypothetical protein
MNILLEFLIFLIFKMAKNGSTMFWFFQLLSNNNWIESLLLHYIKLSFSAIDKKKRSGVRWRWWIGYIMFFSEIDQRNRCKQKISGKHIHDVLKVQNKIKETKNWNRKFEPIILQFWFFLFKVITITGKFLWLMAKVKKCDLV